VFTRTKRGADRVAKELNKNGITSESIHGDKSQGARVRALNGFKNRVVRVLVATDIAARGIDVDKLTHVINYEIPEVAETYVHRIGRTGSAGSAGKLIKQTISVVSSHPYTN
jgi:ATP-dependent RNA helicase RhlE